MKEIWVQPLGREDPLEEEMATHSSVLAWRILLTEEPGRLQSMRSQRVGQNWSDLVHTYCMCLEHQARSWALWLSLVILQSPNIPILTYHWSSNILRIWFPPSVLQIYIFWWELPWWLHGKEPACQCRRCRFDSWGSKISWRRKWQPIPVFSPVKSQGQRRLVGYSPCTHKEVRNDLATTKKQILWCVTNVAWHPQKTYAHIRKLMLQRNFSAHFFNKVSHFRGKKAKLAVLAGLLLRLKKKKSNKTNIQSLKSPNPSKAIFLYKQ